MKKITDPRQLTFEFVIPQKYEFEIVAQTPHGYGLFRRQNEIGCWEYYTDQYGVGFRVYDEALTDLVSTFAAMNHADRDSAKRMWKYLGEVFDFDKE